jgi:hypothetical protein
MSDEAPDDRRRRLNRERVRRHRRLLKHNRVVVPVVATEGMIDAMVGAGTLTDAEADDREAIGRAIGAFFALAMLWKRKL